MSNRRFKSLAAEDDLYDDDDYYEEEGGAGADGGDEMTDEDREQLRTGTASVRKVLGPEYSNVPTKDIEEALWHYYYDIDKSVTYLKNKHRVVVATPKKTPTEKKDWRLFSPIRQLPLPNGFWDDCPWLQVPLHRQALIIEHTSYPRGKLLGGASKEGKMSKLQALAAKRRQQATQKSSPAEPGTPSAVDEYTKSLNKLRLTQSKGSSKADMETAPTSDIDADSAMQDAPPVSSDLQDEDSKRGKEEELASVQDLQARPSPFASILTNASLDAQSEKSDFVVDSKPHPKAFNFTEPSPDDLISKAQTVATPKSNTKATTRTQGDLTDGVAQISIDPVKVKSKNLDVIAEYKKVKRKNAANFVVIGHVDAGKSTLMGRLLFDLKAVDQRTMDRYKKEAESIGKGSFAFAWVLDQGSEERERGVTIDIATNNFATDKTNFTILDAPGHRDFVPNMIAGASQADFAVLVIDASTGNFESGLKGQTKEHALLVRSIGAQRIIVAVNKMDAAGWSEARFDDIQQQMSTFLTGAGFQPKNVTFVPCSGLEGSNILQKVTDKRASWYSGPTLVEVLDQSEPTTYDLDKPLRITISDVFRGGIQNPLSISGRIEAGTLQVGDAIIVMPSQEVAHIKGVDVDDEPADWAVAGQNVTLHLAGIDVVHLKTGDVVCTPASPMRNITEFKAKVLALEFLTPMTVDVHRGRLHVPGRIVQLLATLDKSTREANSKRKPKMIQPGIWAQVVVRLDQAVPLEAPARVILRANGQTVATGIME